MNSGPAFTLYYKGFRLSLLIRIMINVLFNGITGDVQTSHLGNHQYGKNNSERNYPDGLILSRTQLYILRHLGLVYASHVNEK